MTNIWSLYKTLSHIYINYYIKNKYINIHVYTYGKVKYISLYNENICLCYIELDSDLYILGSYEYIRTIVFYFKIYNVFNIKDNNRIFN